MLIIKNSYIKECLDRDLKLLTTKLSAESCFYCANDPKIIQGFELLFAEKQKHSPNSLIIDGFLKVLLAKILEKSFNKNYPSVQDNLYHNFVALLNKPNSQLFNNVNYYAKQLYMTPQNLNAVCRKETNLPASKVLAEYY